MQAPARKTTRFDSGVSKSGVFFILCSLCFYGAPEAASWQGGGLRLGPPSMPELAIPACSAVAGCQPMRFFFFSSGGRSISWRGRADKWEGVHERQKGPGDGPGRCGCLDVDGAPCMIGSGAIIFGFSTILSPILGSIPRHILLARPSAFFFASSIFPPICWSPFRKAAEKYGKARGGVSGGICPTDSIRASVLSVAIAGLVSFQQA
jgi:hypothetical protein